MDMGLTYSTTKGVLPKEAGAGPGWLVRISASVLLGSQGCWEFKLHGRSSAGEIRAQAYLTHALVLKGLVRMRLTRSFRLVLWEGHPAGLGAKSGAWTGPFQMQEPYGCTSVDRPW